MQVYLLQLKVRDGLGKLTHLFPFSYKVLNHTHLDFTEKQLIAYETKQFQKCSLPL